MQTLNRALLSGVAADATQSSAVVSSLSLSAVSLQSVVSGGSGITGTLYLDGSNEESSPAQFVEIETLAVSGNGSAVTPPTASCYRWLQCRWVPSAGTGGTINVTFMAQSGPSPSSGGGGSGDGLTQPEVLTIVWYGGM